MTITKIKTHLDAYKVSFDDNTTLLLPAETMIKMDLFLGKTLSDNEYDALLVWANQYSVFNKILKYALKGKSKTEIINQTQKLISDKVSQNKIIKQMEKLRLIDDQLIINQYVAKGESAQKLRYSLKTRLINAEDIDNALTDYDEIPGLLKCIEKNRKRLVKYPDSDLRMKRYLLSQGYSYETIETYYN